MENSENSEKSEQTIVIAGASNGQMTLTFADGPHLLQDWVIEYLGGENEVKKIAPALAGVEYDVFMEGFHAKMSKDKLNRFQDAFIGSHFSRF